MLIDNKWVQTPIKKTGYPSITHAVPFKAEKDRDYYDYDHRCFIKEHQTTELMYDKDHLEVVDGKPLLGWWVYDVHTYRKYTPSSNPHDIEYYDRLAKLPGHIHEQYLCPHDAYIEDSIRRREEDDD